MGAYGKNHDALDALKSVETQQFDAASDEIKKAYIEYAGHLALSESIEEISGQFLNAVTRLSKSNKDSANVLSESIERLARTLDKIEIGSPNTPAEPGK